VPHLWLLWLQLKRNITVHVIKIHPFWNNLRRVNTLCTISLNTENSVRCLRVYLCRLCGSHNNSDYFLNKINWFVFVIQTQSFNCEPEIHHSSHNAEVGSCDCHALFPSVCYRTSNFELFGRFSPTWYEGEATGGHQRIIFSYLTTQRTPTYEWGATRPALNLWLKNYVW
jgi:hypothetical protein